MKVLHLINVHAWTGPADYVIKISKFLNEKNEQVLVGFRSAYKGVFKEELQKSGIPFTEKLKLPRGFKPNIFISDNYNLRKILNEFLPDIVHCHNTLENIHCAIIKKNSPNFKLVRTVYNLRTLKKKPFSSLLFNKNDYIITVCNDYKDRLIHYQKVLEEKIKIINGFVDIDKFSPTIGQNYDFFEKEYNLDKNIIKIGMVARFQEKRGHRYLIRAFSKLINEKYTSIRLILVGRGENLEPMKQLVSDLNIEDKVIFTGYIKDRLPELLNSLDIFVLLEEGSDGTCRAVLEAMASGLPIIAVKRGALKETVRENINGLFIDKKDSYDLLAIQLKKLIDNKEIREYMGIKSREIAVKYFSMKSVLTNYYNFYRSLLNE